MIFKMDSSCFDAFKASLEVVILLSFLLLPDSSRNRNVWKSQLSVIYILSVSTAAFVAGSFLLNSVTHCCGFNPAGWQKKLKDENKYYG
jgi:hypothetical protein